MDVFAEPELPGKIKPAARRDFAQPVLFVSGVGLLASER